MNEPSSERGDYGGGRSRVNHASRNCFFDGDSHGVSEMDLSGLRLIVD